MPARRPIPPSPAAAGVARTARGARSGRASGRHSRPGAASSLVAPDDPLPLLAQIEQRSPGAFTVEYLERGPETWRLRLSHR
ncbi:DUF2249 domain-containing protein [Streptomyces sp. NBC_00637]|uniref:DUF2249 domain-containing protein n=1 Tax=Streptomyces sp. NBC_00637 TaxID=2903667 RepID=UPI003248B044